MRTMKALGAVASAAALSLVGSGLALADNLHDDLVAGSSTTFAAGGSATMQFYLIGNGSDGCNVDASHTAIVSIGAPAGLTATPSTLTFTQCQDGANKHAQNVTFTSSAPGTYTLSPSAAGGISGNNGWNFNEAQTTFTVTEAVVLDTTGPEVSYTTSPVGPNGTNNWFTSDVTITWSVSDPESAISSTSGCDPVTVSTETTGITYTCIATSGGGTTSVTTSSIKLDKSAPTTSIDVSAGTLGDNNWYRSDVTLSTTGNDTISNPTSCDGDQYLTNDSTGTLFTGHCSNDAGLIGSDTITVKRDATPPTNVAFVGGPADGGYYFPTTVPAAGTCTADDATSLVASCVVTDSLATPTTLGTHTLTATATDNAGNSTTATRTYTVYLLTLNGFFQPVDMNEVLNTVKAGSTVPLKFTVFDRGVAQTSTAVVTAFGAKQYTCGTTPVPEDAIEMTTTGGTTLRYDTTGAQFIQNWQTPKSAGTCWVATATFVDGSKLSALFKLK